MATSELEILVTAVDQASGELNKVASAAGNMGKVAAGVAVAGVAALGAAVVGVGKLAFDASNEFDAAMDALVISTGKSGAALDEMGASVQALFVGSGGRGGRGMEDIGRVIGEVSSRMNLAGAPLQRFTDQLFKLSNLTGTEAGQNLESVNKLMGQFGVEAEDATFFLDELLVATQKTGLSLEDMQASLSTLAPTTQAFGLDMIDVIELTDKLTAAGIDATVANTGLKSALAQMAKDGITPSKEALEDLVAQVAGPDGLNVALEYFGAKAGPAFYQAIQDGSITVQSFSGDIDGVTGAIDKTTTATEGWQESWLTIKNTITTSLIPLGDVIKTFLDTHGKAFTEWFIKHVPAAIETAITAFSKFIDTISQEGIKVETGVLAPGQALQESLGVGVTGRIMDQLRTLRDTGPGYIDDTAINNWISLLARGQQNQMSLANPVPILGGTFNMGGDAPYGVVHPQNLPPTVPYAPGVIINNYGPLVTTDLQNQIDNAIQGQGVR